MIIFMQGCSNHYGYGMLHVLSEIWREKSNMALRAGSGLQTRGVGGGAGGVRGGGGHSSMGYNCGRCVDVGDVGEEATNYFTFECESETITIAHVRG